jgi:hypothetical protein
MAKLLKNENSIPFKLMIQAIALIKIPKIQMITVNNNQFGGLTKHPTLISDRTC